MYTTLISIEDAYRELSEQPEQTVIVDCRYALADWKWGRRAYESGHVPGAVYADLNMDLSGPIVPGTTGRHPLPEPEAFVRWVRQTGIDHNSQVIVYDQAGGGIAARLWWLLRWAGHDAVAVMDGGWDAWSRAGLTADTSTGIRQASSFTPSFRKDMVAEIQSILNINTKPNAALIDSREERRYAGIEEPIDPVAGHIPGAQNIPFAGNLASNGHWKSPAELQDRFRSLTANCAAQDVVFYCGSGVTACHNILAFKHAGLGDATLYPGSWSEWITDPARKIELPASV